MLIYITLIYATFPETIEVYQLAMIKNSEELRKLKKAHGNFGNTLELEADVEDIVNNWLPNWLGGQQDKLIYSDVKNCNYPVTNVLAGHLIVTGFQL